MEIPTIVQHIAEDAGAIVHCYDDAKRLIYATPSWLDQSVGTPFQSRIGANFSELVPENAAAVGNGLLDRIIRGEERIRRVGFFFGRLATLTLRRLPCEGEPARCIVMVSLRPIRSRAEYEAALADRSNEPAAINDRGVLSKLTIRQAEVLALVAQGLPGPQIARTLHRTPKAIEFHRQSIKEKLGFGSVAELTNLAVESGLYLLRVDEVGFWWRRGGDRSRALPQRTSANAHAESRGDPPVSGLKV